MTCKDCLHYGICRMDVCFIHANNGDTYQCQDSDKVEEDCEAFTDKSEWVHLPCKVGDVVYCFEPCFDTDHHPKLEVVEKEIIELKTIATVFGLNFDINSIGKTVFLTREEAEKALKDMRKASNGGKTDD